MNQNRIKKKSYLPDAHEISWKKVLSMIIPDQFFIYKSYSKRFFKMPALFIFYLKICWFAKKIIGLFNS